MRHRDDEGHIAGIHRSRHKRNLEHETSAPTKEAVLVERSNLEQESNYATTTPKRSEPTIATPTDSLSFSRPGPIHNQRASANTQSTVMLSPSHLREQASLNHAANQVPIYQDQRIIEPQVNQILQTLEGRNRQSRPRERARHPENLQTKQQTQPGRSQPPYQSSNQAQQSIFLGQAEEERLIDRILLSIGLGTPILTLLVVGAYLWLL